MEFVTYFNHILGLRFKKKGFVHLLLVVHKRTSPPSEKQKINLSSELYHTIDLH